MSKASFAELVEIETAGGQKQLCWKNYLGVVYSEKCMEEMRGTWQKTLAEKGAK